MAVMPLPNGKKIASIVMDQEEFDGLLDEYEMISGNVLTKDGKLGELKSQIEAIRRAKQIPMMMKGTKTKRFFDRYDVPSDVDMLCVAVRGLAQRMGVR
jgi:hypothetical protein